jgi:acyl-CoA synthetase (AMP-forming)/AMP-acid ligase II
MLAHHYNLASDLESAVARHPAKPAVICSAGVDGVGRARYDSWTFEKLWEQTTATAGALRARGVEPGTRVLIFMKPSLEFTAVMFALQVLGAVPVLIDPGIGVKRLLICIREAAPEVMIGIPKAHLLRALFPGYFRSVKSRIVVGVAGWLARLLLPKPLSCAGAAPVRPLPGNADDPGAILFTSGSTGIPKGVELLRRHIAAQKRAWNEAFELREDDIDLVTFPIFLLVSAASGRTCVVPDMDFSRPITIDPARFAQAIADHAPTFCFGSPALWNKISRHAVVAGTVWYSLRCVVTGGAPVAPAILERLRRIAPNARCYTPFGSTEALPITNITAEEILNVTQYGSHSGRGTCVGRPAAGVEVRIVPVTERALPEWSEVEQMPAGQIGEIVVSGPVVTESYFRRDVQTRLAKSSEIDRASGKRRVWHRMGDTGYFDEQGRLWFCGRVKHIAWQGDRPFYSVQVEGIFNCLPGVGRSALVNVGHGQDRQLALVIEPDGELDGPAWLALVRSARAHADLYGVPLRHYLWHDGPFPVDRRHNAKIEREKLALWAQKRLGSRLAAAKRPDTETAASAAGREKRLRRA